MSQRGSGSSRPVSIPSLNFRPDLQGLRAIAVALVVLAHANVAGFQGGFIGVDVFFVLSGYLITGLLLKEKRATGNIQYWRFLSRRLRRLLPALLVTILSVLLAGSLLLSDYELRLQTESVPYAATWLSNFYFAFGEQDYFEALRADDLFLHTWSLGVEEQFYVLWPWLVMLFFALKLRSGDGSGELLLGGLGVVFVSSLALCLYLANTLPVLSFYMMPARGWQFAMGGLLYVWVSERQHSAPQATSSLLWIPLITGTALVIGSALLIRSSMNYPSYYALLPSIGTMLLILSAEGRLGARNNGPLSFAPLVWLGDRSYSIYLWHWPVLIIGKAYGLLDQAAGLIVLLVLVIVLSDISYRFVELPFWKGCFSKRGRPLSVVVVSGLAIALTIGLYWLLVVWPDEQQASGFPPGYNPRHDAPVNVYRSDLGCDTGHFSAQITPCGIGNPDADKLVLMLGDSVGTQWATMVSGVFSSPDWQVIVLTKSACAIVDEDYYYEKADGIYTVCSDWKRSALGYIDMLEPDVVVVGSSASYAFSEDQWIGGSRRILERLAASAAQVVVLAGTPQLSFNGPSCLREPAKFRLRLRGGDRDCQEAMSDLRSRNVAGYLQLAARELQNVDVLDLGDLVCPAGRCAAISDDGIAVFRDEGHLTATFASSLVPVARERLRGIGICQRLAGDTSEPTFEPCTP